jgi:hypothetical protein
MIEMMKSNENTAPLHLFVRKGGEISTKTVKKSTLGFKEGLKLRLAPNLAKSEFCPPIVS